jgi:hypothetical protein
MTNTNQQASQHASKLAKASKHMQGINQAASTAANQPATNWLRQQPNDADSNTYTTTARTQPVKQTVNQPTTTETAVVLKPPFPLQLLTVAPQ